MRRLGSYNELAFMARGISSSPVNEAEFARKGNSLVHENHTRRNKANIAFSEPESRDYFNNNQILLHDEKTARSKRRASLETASRFEMKRAKLESFGGEEFLGRDAAEDGCEESTEKWDSKGASTNTTRSLSDTTIKLCQACKVWLPAQEHLVAIAERNQVFATQTELGTKTAESLKPSGFSLIGTGWEKCMQCCGIRLHSYATANKIQPTPSMNTHTFGETNMDFTPGRNINISRENSVKANSRTSPTGSPCVVWASDTEWGDEKKEFGRRSFEHRSTDRLRSPVISSLRTQSTEVACFPVPRDFTLSASPARSVKSRSEGSYPLPEEKAGPDLHCRREHMPTSSSTYIQSHYPEVPYVGGSGSHVKATVAACTQAQRSPTSAGEAAQREFGCIPIELPLKPGTIIADSSRGNQLDGTVSLQHNHLSTGSCERSLGEEKAHPPRSSRDLRKLNAHDVRTYLESTDCRQYAKFFEEEDIDGAALSILSMVELARLLNIKIGPAIRLHKHLREMASSAQ